MVSLRRRLPALLQNKPAAPEPDASSTTPDEEALLPRWLRPSVRAARVASPKPPASIERRAPLLFSKPVHGGTERLAIRYDRVQLLDRPDEALGMPRGELDTGDEIDVIERDPIWAHVRTPANQDGWVPAMTLVTPDALPPEPALDAAADALAGSDGEVEGPPLEELLAIAAERRALADAQPPVAEAARPQTAGAAWPPVVANIADDIRLPLVAEETRPPVVAEAARPSVVADIADDARAPVVAEAAQPPARPEAARAPLAETARPSVVADVADDVQVPHVAEERGPVISELAQPPVVPLVAQPPARPEAARPAVAEAPRPPVAADVADDVHVPHVAEERGPVIPEVAQAVVAEVARPPVVEAEEVAPRVVAEAAQPRVVAHIADDIQPPLTEEVRPPVVAEASQPPVVADIAVNVPPPVVSEAPEPSAVEAEEVAPAVVAKAAQLPVVADIVEDAQLPVAETRLPLVAEKVGPPAVAEDVPPPAVAEDPPKPVARAQAPKKRPSQAQKAKKTNRPTSTRKKRQ